MVATNGRRDGDRGAIVELAPVADDEAAERRERLFLFRLRRVGVGDGANQVVVRHETEELNRFVRPEITLELELRVVIGWDRDEVALVLRREQLEIPVEVTLAAGDGDASRGAERSLDHRRRVDDVAGNVPVKPVGA